MPKELRLIQLHNLYDLEIDILENNSKRKSEQSNKRPQLYQTL